MELKQLFYSLLGIAGLFGAFLIWSNADKIRESKYWAIGWLGYLFCILIGFEGLGRTGMFNNLPM